MLTIDPQGQLPVVGSRSGRGFPLDLDVVLVIADGIVAGVVGKKYRSVFDFATIAGFIDLIDLLFVIRAHYL